MPTNNNWINTATIKAVKSIYDRSHCNTNCHKPTKSRRYIKILKLCEAEPLTAQEIYGVKNPMTDVLKALVRLGYMECLTKADYVVPRHVYPDFCDIRKVWWQTTPKGKTFADAVLNG